MMKGLKQTLTLVALWGVSAWPQEMAVPVGVQYPLLLKVLVFDRNFEARSGDELVMGIMYQSEHRRSDNVKDALLQTIEESPLRTVKGVPVRAAPIDISHLTDLSGALARHQVDIVYVAPLRAFDLERIVRVSRERKVTTMTGIPEYCDAGIAVGIDLRGGKPEILIDVHAARAEGAEFSSRLLRLCKIVR